MFTGCSLLEKVGLLDRTSDETSPVSSIEIGQEEAEVLSTKVPVHLYFANEANTKLVLEVRHISAEDARKKTSELAKIIVEELIKGPVTSGLKATIPEGTKLRSVKVKDGTATVDFSKEFKTAHPGGVDAEKMTIYSIVNSLTELKDIQYVKFTIAGKTEKEYLGGFRFDQPFPRSENLISRDTAVPGTGSRVVPDKDEPDKEKPGDKSAEAKKDDNKDGNKKDENKKDENNNNGTVETSGTGEEVYQLLE